MFWATFITTVKGPLVLIRDKAGQAPEKIPNAPATNKTMAIPSTTLITLLNESSHTPLGSKTVQNLNYLRSNNEVDFATVLCQVYR